MNRTSYRCAAAGAVLVFCACAGAQTFGNTTPYTDNEKDVEEQQLATKVTLTDAGTIVSISAYVKGAAGRDIRFAIYEDDSGAPGDLIAETPAEDILGNANFFAWRTIATPAVALAPGDYWLALAFEFQLQHYSFESAPAGVSVKRSYDAVANGFESTWSSGGTSDLGNRIAIYATLGSEALLGHWILNDTIGAVAADSSGNAFHGTVTGAEWKGNECAALRFDGDDDYVRVPADPLFDVTENLTIAAWVTSDLWGAGFDVDTILRKGEDDPVAYQFAIKDGIPTLFLDESDNNSGFAASAALPTGVWSHVVATWDGDDVRIYIDGVQDGDSPMSHSSTLSTDARDIYVGGRWGATDVLLGKLRDVRFYNYALDASEVAQLFSNTQCQEFRVTQWDEIPPP